MSDLRIAGVGSANAPVVAKPLEPAVKGAGFGESLGQALDQVNQLQKAADRASQDFALGQSRDVASTLIAIEKATLGFQFALQIRNKLLEAYQEVMRMPM
jgi:flagellar hook-basal body complex protein FliE